MNKTECTLPAGEYWFQLIRRGEIFRIIDLEGNQAVDTLFYCADDTSDRYDSQLTIRSQGNVYLSTGTKLLSTTGRVMLTIIDDTCGRHDTLGGACSAESNSVRYPLDRRHMHSCRDSYLRAFLENDLGLSKRDLGSNINFFMNVPVDPEGGSRFSDGISAPGKYVELKAERDVYCLISNCPQLNNPCNAYNPTPVLLTVGKGDPDES